MTSAGCLWELRLTSPDFDITGEKSILFVLKLSGKGAKPPKLLTHRQHYPAWTVNKFQPMNFTPELSLFGRNNNKCKGGHYITQVFYLYNYWGHKIHYYKEIRAVLFLRYASTGWMITLLFNSWRITLESQNIPWTESTAQDHEPGSWVSPTPVAQARKSVTAHGQQR